MEAWAPITLTKVDDDNGNFTALFPPNCTTEAGATTQGSLRRRSTAGTLYRIEVYSSDAAGGVIELWDLDGLYEGVNNNTSIGSTMTNAFKNQRVAMGQAKLLWTQMFSGDEGSCKAIFKCHVPFVRGLAARYINPVGTSCIISLVVDGGYYKSEINGV